MYKVIVNGFRLADHANRAACLSSVSGELTYSVHGVIAPDIEEPADIHFLEFFEKKRVNRIFQRFRQFVTAGTKISAWCVFQIIQLFTWQSFTEIQNPVLKKAFDSVYHTVNFANLIRMSNSLGNHSVKTAVDHCCRAAGLSDDQILFCHFVPPIWIIVGFPTDASIPYEEGNDKQRKRLTGNQWIGIEQGFVVF